MDDLWELRVAQLTARKETGISILLLWELNSANSLDEPGRAPDEARRGRGPANTLISEFWPPKL